MIKIESLEELESFAKDFSKKIKKNDIYVLEGDLGAGKTTFVQYLAKILNVRETVTSPSFPILNVYNGDLEIYHFDLYRLNSADELENVGFYEYLANNGVCFIEWGKKFPEQLPRNSKTIKISHLDNGRREIMIE